jgi:hypothetical protein
MSPCGPGYQDRRALHKALEHPHPCPIIARRTGPQALVALCLPHPAPQGLRLAADLRSERADCRSSRGVISLVVDHHPNRALANFRCVFRRGLVRHGSILSRDRASGNPGAVHPVLPRLRSWNTSFQSVPRLSAVTSCLPLAAHLFADSIMEVTRSISGVLYACPGEPPALSETQRQRRF